MTAANSTVWVVGLGTVGSALVGLFAQRGLRLVAVAENPEALAEGRRRVEDSLVDDSGFLDQVEYTTRLDSAPAADFVVEALPERLEDKCAVLRELHGRCGPETVFLTTTTGLSVTEIASRSGRMTRTLGLHLADFSALASATTVEVVRTPLTEPGAARAVLELVRTLDRTPVPVHDHPGFVGGALMMAYLNSAAKMYEQGYGSRDDIDAAMTMGCGLPRGPLEQVDAIGVDTVHDALTALYERSGDDAYAPAAILPRMVAGGLLGAKSGQGFYRYDSARRRAADPVRTSVERTDEVRPVHRIGIVGSGSMATGIAEVCARGGYPVTVVARIDIRAKELRAAVEGSCARLVERGRLSPADMAAALERLTVGTDLAELGTADLVIEAVVEDLEVKLEVFAALDRVTKADAVLATITSSLPVARCAMATRRPQDVVGMHFFNPAPRMRLIEVVRTFATAGDTVATVHAVAATLGKHAVDCTDRTGFIVNALLFPYLNRAVTMLRERNASVDDIDAVMTGGSGFPLGPFHLLDLVGLDVSLAIQNRLWQTFPDSESKPARYLDDLVQAGFLGRKTGRGFHPHPA